MLAACGSFRTNDAEVAACIGEKARKEGLLAIHGLCRNDASEGFNGKTGGLTRLCHG